MKDSMRYAVLVGSPGWPRRSAAQEPSGPKPVQPARPLALPTLRPPVADTGIFSPPPLPPPNEIRRADGAPGRDYWQQRADYAIRATLDTASRRITGTDDDPLHQQLARYAPIRVDAAGPESVPPRQHRLPAVRLGESLRRRGVQGRIRDRPRGPVRGAASAATGADAGPRHGVQRPTRRPPASAARRPRPRRHCGARVDDTMMYLDLVRPIPPGGATVLDLAYAFNVPEHGADRMGRDGSLYEIAQWYPRMAVYDDVHGWNTDQYLGQGEFYLEYGDIDYEVTLPAGYIVAGTGVLQNPAEVLTDHPAGTTGRGRQVRHHDPDRDRARAALGRGAPEHGRDRSPGASGPRTCVTRPGRRRRSISGMPPAGRAFWPRRTTVPRRIETWKDAARMSRYSIQEYSTRWFRYPYPQISAVEGPVSGMEYPMLAMEARGKDAPDLFEVVTHEIGHNWYPDDRGLRRAAVCLDGRGLQHLHQHLRRGGLLEAGRLRGHGGGSGSW